MAKKTITGLNARQSEFQKVFSKLCYGTSAWQAWSDFVECTAIGISNTVDPRKEIREERERRYMDIVVRYGPDEIKLFPQLCGILTNALEENPEQDFLGNMFMALELGSHWHGQFFTPYHLCKAMALLIVQDALAEAGNKRWISLNDPACGAGATLIGARNVLQGLKIGSEQALFVAQDLDRTAATLALRRGMPIEQVSRMLGHENITTTQIYTTITDDEVQRNHQKYLT